MLCYRALKCYTENRISVAPKSRTIFYRREGWEGSGYADKTKTLYGQFPKRHFAFSARGLPAKRHEGRKKDFGYFDGILPTAGGRTDGF